MDYYIYQNGQFHKAYATEQAGREALAKLFASWKLNAPRVPELKLCYNGFKSELLAKLGGGITHEHT